MIVRPMTTRDLDQVALLEEQCFSVPWSKAVFQVSLQEPHHRFLVAEEDGAILGYAGCYIILDEADVTNIAVSEKIRRLGVGRTLLQALKNVVRDAGAETLFLEVRESNDPAIRLYTSEGFTQVGRRKDYYEDPREDALLYAFSLKRNS